MVVFIPLRDLWRISVSTLWRIWLRMVANPIFERVRSLWRISQSNLWRIVPFILGRIWPKLVANPAFWEPPSEVCDGFLRWLCDGFLRWLCDGFLRRLCDGFVTDFSVNLARVLQICSSSCDLQVVASLLCDYTWFLWLHLLKKALEYWFEHFVVSLWPDNNCFLHTSKRTCDTWSTRKGQGDKHANLRLWPFANREF